MLPFVCFEQAAKIVRIGSVRFKDTPFYQIQEEFFTRVVECPSKNDIFRTEKFFFSPNESSYFAAMTTYRHTVKERFSFSSQTLAAMKADPKLRIMAFCAGETGLGTYTKNEVAFPHQCEIKVNGFEVKANLRGLKNKPGSTRPPDITNLLQMREKYNNEIELTYALTSKVSPDLIYQA